VQFSDATFSQSVQWRTGLARHQGQKITHVGELQFQMKWPTVDGTGLRKSRLQLF
jgi:hypothetical protein